MGYRHCHGVITVDDLYPQKIERHGETWLDVHAAAIACGVAERTVRRWVASQRVRSRTEVVYNKAEKLYVAVKSLPAELVPIADVESIPEEKRRALSEAGLNVHAVVEKKTGKVRDLVFDV